MLRVNHPWPPATATQALVLDPRASTIMAAERVLPKTIRTYMAALNRFHTLYLLPQNLVWHNSPLSQKTLMMVNHITRLRHSPDATRGAISTFVRAISWHHHTSFIDHADPSLSEAIVDYRRAIEHTFLDNPIKRRLPFTKAQIRLIARAAYEWAMTRPQFYRIFVLIILSYKAATRISELLRLTRGDLILAPTWLRFNFPTRKTKKRRLPELLYMADDPLSAFCPLKIMSNYLSHQGLLTCPANMSKESFHASLVFPGGFVDYHTGVPTGPISYHQVYNQLVELLAFLKLDPHKFGWHSPRSTAITHMQSAGMSDKDIATHTGHHDITSLGSYAQGTIPSRLKASQHLRL
jgi:integrase